MKLPGIREQQQIRTKKQTKGSRMERIRVWTSIRNQTEEQRTIPIRRAAIHLTGRKTNKEIGNRFFCNCNKETCQPAGLFIYINSCIGILIGSNGSQFIKYYKSINYNL
jgi:hypothetical protein